MKLVVFSDSHGSSEEMTETLERLHPDAEYVIHLGDGSGDLSRFSMLHPEMAFVSVYGNCDAASYSAPLSELERTLDLGDVRIFLCHGHTCAVRSGADRVISKARAHNADIALFGHTHRSQYSVIPPEREGEKPLILLNPGSISRPHGGELPGRSYAVITVTKSEGITVRLLPY